MKKNYCGLISGECNVWKSEFLRKMRIVLLLLLISITQTFALESYGQTKQLSLNCKNETILKILDQIENQSEFYFMFDATIIDVNQRKSINCENQPIKMILDQLLEGTKIVYEISDRQIVLTTSQKINVEQHKAVSGKVSDSSGSPLPGVTVIIKGTTNGTVTNADGQYSLANVPNDATLQFSFVGMKTQEIQIQGQSNINVTMEVDAIGIEEVVAIGYGTVKKKDLTGSVARVNQEVFESRPATTLTDVLRGGITGLNVGYNTDPKGGGSLLVRGRTSLSANNSPLIVVDGAIYNGDISDINPMDIANVDILKDASSAAIYGSRSASGVVMITTKKGKSPKPTINFLTTVGVTQLVNEIPLFTPEQYLIAKRDYMYRSNGQAEEGYYHNPNNLPTGVSLELWRNYVPSPNPNNEEEWINRLGLTSIEKLNYLAGNTVDMMDLIRQTGVRQNYNVSISANTNLLQYYWSLGYVDNEGTTIGDRYKNIRSRLNIEAKVTDYLKIGVNSQMANSNQGFVPRGFINDSWQNFESPYGSLYNEDGSLRIDMDGNGQGPRNPLRSDLVDRLYEEFSFGANLYALVDLPWGFSYEIRYYNRKDNIKNYQFYPEEVDPGVYKGGSANRSEYNSVESTIDNILKWDLERNRHKINVTLLANAEKFTCYQSDQSNINFSPNALLGYHNLGIGSNPIIGTNDETQTADALMGRINYSLMDKYIFMASVRRDGYSAFGQKNPRHVFPAASLGWVISEEEFFRANFVDYLKLRLSWGANGNREIGRYSALAQMETLKYLEGDHQTVVGLGLSSMPNSELQWESTEAINMGFDFALFNEKLYGSLEYYRMKTTNLLLTRTLPVMTGYESVIANLGQVDNHGFEATLNWTNVKQNKFTWKSYFTASINRNEIVHLYGDMEDVLDEEGNVIGQKESDDISNGWFIGHAIDAVYDYNRLGIYQLDEAELAASYGRMPGDIKFEDLNNDGAIDATNDRKFLGHSEPRLRLGIRNEIYFLNNFDFSFFIYAQLGQMATENLRAWIPQTISAGNYYNVEYWTPDNPTNDFARIEAGINRNWWNKSSFLRMQNITLGYNLPANLVNKIGVSKLRAYLNIDNAFVITNYYKYDPETYSPTPRNISLGINLTL